MGKICYRACSDIKVLLGSSLTLHMPGVAIIGVFRGAAHPTSVKGVKRYLPASCRWTPVLLRSRLDAKENRQMTESDVKLEHCLYQPQLYRGWALFEWLSSE